MRRLAVPVMCWPAPGIDDATALAASDAGLPGHRSVSEAIRDDASTLEGPPPILTLKDQVAAQCASTSQNREGSVRRVNMSIKPRISPLKLIVAVLMGVLIGMTVIVRQQNLHPDQGYVIVENSDVAPTLGVLVDQNLRVLSVDPTGSAARAGIEPGDVLKGIGGIALPTTVSISQGDAHSSAPFRAAVLPGTSDYIKQVFHQFVPDWEHTASIELDRKGTKTTLQVFITAQAYQDNPASPPPARTPVPEDMWSSVFYF